MNRKNILLVIVVALIAGVIWYIEASKPPTVAGTSVAISANSTSTPISADRSAILKQKASIYPPAVELIPGGQFINSQPFKLKDLIGKKVILIDFWTYTCINCLRAAPYVNAWYSKYKDAGLVIVGVHSPEFDFEKDYNNVQSAVKNQYHIEYPVVQDNNHATWDAYQNQYWPAEYLIDIDGYIIDTHFGEGSYDQTEAKIQAALKERDQVLGLPDTIPSGIVNPLEVITVSNSGVQSPETYFGAARNEYLGNGTQGTVGAQQLTAPSTIQSNALYLDGTWNFQNEYAENTLAGAKITYKYNAKNVYFVGTASKPVKVTVLLDGKPISAGRGSDVSADGTVTIQENRLYKLVEGSDYGEHTLEIIVNNPGLQAYTFTFG
jgi:thiol-disulfide isomerase/thioredoxin